MVLNDPVCVQHLNLFTFSTNNVYKYPIIRFCCLALYVIAQLGLDSFYFPQVWRHVEGYTYSKVHQIAFDIAETGHHEFSLSPEDRDIIDAGDTIGLFTHLAGEDQVIGFDALPCGGGPTLMSPASIMTSPLNFVVHATCRQYSFNAIFIGNAQI